MNINAPVGGAMGAIGGGGPAGTTKLDYDQMQAITKLFQSNEQDMTQLLAQTKSKVEALHNNQWVGQAADQFFSEMEGTVLPKFQKLVTALNVAGQVSTKITNVIQQADQETKGLFSNIV